METFLELIIYNCNFRFIILSCWKQHELHVTVHVLYIMYCIISVLRITSIVLFYIQNMFDQQMAEYLEKGEVEKPILSEEAAKSRTMSELSVENMEIEDVAGSEQLKV